jgi:4-hydroxy-tetrahydrodipicolinate reductase
MIRVAVLGADGRMGATTCDAIEGAADLDLVSRIEVDDDIAAAVQAANAQVAVDFTVPGVTEANVHALLDAGVNAVVGATGWTDDSIARVSEHLDRVNAQRPADAQLGVLIAPNFAISAVLTMIFAAEAAKYFESAEVVELHHPNKIDAPSGTAQHTAAGIADARRHAGMAPMPDATERGFEARGMDVDGVRVHAVRLRGLVAHEEVLFGNPGEALTIRTDSFDRVSFMPGVLLAVREIVNRPGVTVGLEHLLKR